jgi:threonine synthase
VKVRGNYDDVNRLCTELSGDRENWAFVNINMRPYYSEGSKTVAYEIAEQLGWELPDRVVVPIASGSLYTKIGKGFSEFIDVGLLDGEVPTMNGAQATGCSPVATAFRDGHDFCRPVKPDTIAKSLAIGNPADGPYALELARATGGSTRRSAPASACSRRRRGSSRRPPAASRRRCSRSSPSAARSATTSASSSSSPARA